jgi:hypothetical protein
MRGRVLALVLALIFSASAAIAAPNPKAGASCSKVGSSKTFKGTRFTCIKSGKKIVWSKGVATKSEFGGSSSSSTPSPTPNPSSAVAPTDPRDFRSLIIRYKRYSGDYKGWNLWIWRNSDDNSKDSSISPTGVQFEGVDDYGAGVSLTVTGMRDFKDIGFIVRLNDWQSRDLNIERYISQFDSRGFAEIWLIENDPTIYTRRPDLSSSVKPIPNPSPSSAPSPTPSPTPLRSIPPVSAGVKAALDDLDKYPKSNRKPQPVNFHFAPNADKRLTGLISSAAKATMEFFVDFYQESKPYTIFNGFPEDRDWILAEMAKYGYEVRKWNSDGLTYNYRYKENPIIWIYKEDWQGEKNWFGHAATRQDYINHHVIHGIQAQITGFKDGFLGCWPREGGASFYSWYILGRNYPSIGDPSGGDVTYGSWRSEQAKPRNNWWAPNLDVQALSESDWFKLIKSWDGNKPNSTPDENGESGLPIYCTQSENQHLAYSGGAIMYERLVGEFGHQKVMDWWYEIRTTPDWELAFGKVFKINVDDWYKQSAIPYLIKEFRDYVYIPSK